MAERASRSTSTMVGKVFQILGGAARPLTADEIHAAMVEDQPAATNSSVYRALLELRRRGVARVAAAGCAGCA